MSEVHSEFNAGKQGNKRSSYRAGIREFIARTIRDNPDKTGDELYPLFLAEVAKTPPYIDACAQYYWTKQYKYATKEEEDEDPDGDQVHSADHAGRVSTGGGLGGTKSVRPDFRHPPPASEAQINAMLGRAAIAKRALLKTYKIDGKPLAECTGARVRDQASRHALDAYFLNAVATGVPDEEAVGARRSEEEAWQMYLAAMSAAA